MAANEDISAKELKRRDFIVNGNLWRVVFVLSFPLFVYTVFNYFYSIIDTIMCSGISKSALDAVGALSQVTNMITALGAGLASGCSILIAHEIGKRNYEKAKRYASTAFAYVFLIALATCAIVIPLSVPLLRFFGISEASIAVGKEYFMISVATSAIIMVNTVFLGVEKAKGSMVSITVLNVAVVLVKVALNALFLYGFGWADMLFVSLATLIANALLTLYILIRLASPSYLFRFQWKKIDWSKYVLSRTSAMAFPIFLGKFIFSLGKVVINGLCKSYGDDVVGALGVSNNMGGAVTNPLSSIEDSTSAIIATNLGAKKAKRAIDAFYIGLVYNLGIAILGVVLISIFDTPITQFFARSIADEAARNLYAQHISKVFFYEKMGIITLAINSSLLGLLYGFGYTRLSMAINIARVFVFRIPSFLIAKALLGNEEESGYLVAGISMGFSNIAIGLVAIIVAVYLILKLQKRIRQKEGAQTLTLIEKERLGNYIDHFLATFTHYKPNGKWCYEDGVLLQGVYQLYRVTRDKKYFDFCLRYFETNIGEDGSLTDVSIESHSSDDLLPGYTLFYVNAVHPEAKFDKALDFLRRLLAEQPRTDEGSFWHKNRYPNQVWLDGLYMVEPFYALESSRTGSLAMKKDILRQFRNVERHNKNPENGRYYHAYDATKSFAWADKTNGLSPNVWLRSVGWLAMAAVDVASIDLDNHFYYYARLPKKILGEAVASLDSARDKESQLYYDLPFVKAEGNYLETSGSLMLAYAEMKGARLGLLPTERMQQGIATFEGVLRRFFDGEHLRNIVLVSGLDPVKRDGSVAYYLSEQVVADDVKGVGPLLMAYAEYLSMPY